MTSDAITPSCKEENSTVIDLFSGAGGSGLGFVSAGFEIVAAVEIDSNAAMTYQKNLGIAPLVGDIRTISPKKFRNDLELSIGGLGVLLGCPPCQGFTRMRNSAGANDPRNDLVMNYMDFVKEFLPRFVVFENVPGLARTRHGKEYYNRLKIGLQELGYHIKTWEVDAADFGVPQHRRRIIIIAGREDEVPPNLMEARTHGSPDSSEVLCGKLKPWLTVRDAISRFPSLERGEEYADVPNHKARNMGVRVYSFITQVPPDGGSRTDVSKEHWLACHINHKGHLDVYGRLAWNSPANVITSGCTNVSKGRFVHPEQDRGLSVREAAALQGFPDNFSFVGGMDSISAQIGNAVPPPLADAIGRILKSRFSNGR